MTRMFVPGFGARASFYRDALGDGWLLHDHPPFRARAGFDAHVEELRRSLERYDEPLLLAGHSLGAAVAVAAAAQAPERIARLLLIAPAGLPLTKPIRASLRDFTRQMRTGVYPRAELNAALRDLAAAPFAAFRLARAVHELDLRRELDALRGTGIHCDVVGCTGDTLTPTSHCRRIAELAGARFREITARGGHMWMVVDPSAFATVAR